jgi:hypothetical protein
LTEEGEKIITTNLNVGGDGDGVDTIEEHDEANPTAATFIIYLYKITLAKSCAHGEMITKSGPFKTNFIFFSRVKCTSGP